MPENSTMLLFDNIKADEIEYLIRRIMMTQSRARTTLSDEKAMPDNSAEAIGIGFAS